MTYPDRINQVKLLVNGEAYGGWKSVRIEAGIERQSRSFDLSVTLKWPGQTGQRQVKAGNTCQVFIGDDLVLTGYVDATPIRYDENSIDVGVKGRSKTADLVDCCPVPAGQSTAQATKAWAGVIAGPVGPGKLVAAPLVSAAQWRNQRLETIAAALAAPYGVRVLCEVDTGRVITDHHIDTGETVFESIDRMMRIRPVLSTDNELGDLVLINVGSGGRATTPLRVGDNVREGACDLDYKAVFTDYIVKGQRAGTDDQFGEDANEEMGQSTSSGTMRRRVLVIKQTGQADDGTCSERADYEHDYRLTKAEETRYVVSGWRQADGSLWKTNQLVHVRDPFTGFDKDMLIASLAYVLDDRGQRTELTVGPPDGYRNKIGGKRSKKTKQSGAAGNPDWSDIQ